MYNPHNLSQPLPPGVIGRAPRNGTIVQQHTHYPFAPQQPTTVSVSTQQPIAREGQIHTVSSTFQQSTPIKKRKLTADNAVPGSNAGSSSAGPSQLARPSFHHQPGSSSSMVSDDTGGAMNEQDRDGDAEKKGGQKKGKKPACTGTGKGPKEKHKAKACIYCRRR
jgi:hypothetical protein